MNLSPLSRRMKRKEAPFRALVCSTVVRGTGAHSSHIFFSRRVSSLRARCGFGCGGRSPHDGAGVRGGVVLPGGGRRRRSRWGRGGEKLKRKKKKARRSALKSAVTAGAVATGRTHGKKMRCRGIPARGTGSPTETRSPTEKGGLKLGIEFEAFLLTLLLSAAIDSRSSKEHPQRYALVYHAHSLTHLAAEQQRAAKWPCTRGNVGEWGDLC